MTQKNSDLGRHGRRLKRREGKDREGRKEGKKERRKEGKERKGKERKGKERKGNFHGPANVIYSEFLSTRILARDLKASSESF